MKAARTLLALITLLWLPLQAAEPASAPAKSEQTVAPDLKALADSLTPVQRQTLMKLLNEGDTAALILLPRIGQVRAAAVQAARPYASPLDLLAVKGVGEVTLAEILKHAKAGSPAASSKAEVKKPKT